MTVHTHTRYIYYTCSEYNARITMEPQVTYYYHSVMRCKRNVSATLTMKCVQLAVEMSHLALKKPLCSSSTCNLQLDEIAQLRK